MFIQELAAWKKESGLEKPIMYKYNYGDKTLTIYTTSPGWLIGRAGTLYEKYKSIIETAASHEVEIKFVETAYDVI